VLKYFGYLLIVLVVLALAASAVVCLFGGLAERFQTVGSVRLVAFDDLANMQSESLRLAARLEDLDYGRPILNAWMVFRFDDGWTRSAWTDTTGMMRSIHRGALGAGRHEFSVSFPDTHPRLDIRARGSVWVLPPGARVLWVDAAALEGAAGPVVSPAGPPGAEAARAARAAYCVTYEGGMVTLLRDHGLPTGQNMVTQQRDHATPPQKLTPYLDTLKTLAAGRQVVYLVSAPAQEYALVRRGLQEIAAPPGPAIWVTPGEEARRLALVRQAGPNVDAALVCSPALADAAAKLKIKVCRVPRAGESVAGAAEGAGGWADVPGQVSGWRGSDKQSGANP